MRSFAIWHGSKIRLFGTPTRRNRAPSSASPALASSPDFRHHFQRPLKGVATDGDADQATETADRLSEQLYQRTRLRTYAGRSWRIFRPLVAGHCAQASAQPGGEGIHQAATQS